MSLTAPLFYGLDQEFHHTASKLWGLTAAPPASRLPHAKLWHNFHVVAVQASSLTVTRVKVTTSGHSDSFFSCKWVYIIVKMTVQYSDIPLIVTGCHSKRGALYIVVNSVDGGAAAAASISQLCEKKMAPASACSSNLLSSTLLQMQNAIFPPKDVLAFPQKNAPPFWRVMMMKGPSTHFSAIHGIFRARASNL